MARVILCGGLMLFCRRLGGWQDKCKRMQRLHREYRSIYCRFTNRQMTIETEHVDFFAIGSSAPVEALGELRRQGGLIKHLASTDFATCLRIPRNIES